MAMFDVGLCMCGVILDELVQSDVGVNYMRKIGRVVEALTQIPNKKIDSCRVGLEKNHYLKNSFISHGFKT